MKKTSSVVPCQTVVGIVHVFKAREKNHCQSGGTSYCINVTIEKSPKVQELHRDIDAHDEKPACRMALCIQLHSPTQCNKWSLKRLKTARKHLKVHVKFIRLCFKIENLHQKAKKQNSRAELKLCLCGNC